MSKKAKQTTKWFSIALVFAIASGIGFNYERYLSKAYGLFKSTEIGNFIDDSISIPLDFEQF